MKIGKLAKGKKAQHEIVGFILIVVILVVIGLFLLVFYLRKGPEEYRSVDIENFLTASMQYSTNCTLDYAPEYEKMQDLIKTCHGDKNKECSDGKNVCGLLNESLSELVHEAWLVNPEKSENAYYLDVYYEYSPSQDGEKVDETTEESTREEILKLSEGNCTGNQKVATYSISDYPGDIVVSMRVCYTLQ